MAKINEMRMPTWAYLGLNKADYDLVEIEKQPYNIESSGESLTEVEQAFKDETFGLAEEIKKENKDFRNFFQSFDIKEDRDTEFINLKLDDENNILVSNIEINAESGTSSSFLVNFSDTASDKIFINSQILDRKSVV